jgi:predicted DCC family thiol-disulfide oxidoreductase YuxK
VAHLLEGVPDDARMATWRLVLPDGTLVERGRGCVVLLRTMRRTRPAGRLLDALPNRVVGSTYGFVARHRSRLGRLVPDRPGPHRFP